jgi:tetratricopeptide (TPR) repeat protein
MINLKNYNIGTSEFNNSNYQLSLEYFTKSIVENHLLGNSFSLAYFYRAMSYYNLNGFEKAIKDFDEAALALFDDFELFLYRGISYFKLKKYDKAIVDFKKVIKLKNDFEEAYIYLYEIYRIIKSEKLAKKTFIKILELNPNNINVINQIGLKYIDMDLYDLAKHIYLDVYNLYPSNLNAIQGLAISNGHLGKYSEAIKYFDILIDLDFENAGHHIKNKELSCFELNKFVNNEKVPYKPIMNEKTSKTMQLNLNEQRIQRWKNDILDALTKDETFDIAQFNQYLEQDDFGKSFIENIAYNSKAYHYLNNLGLVNQKYCPITGEDIDESFNYSVSGRHIFISQNGLEIFNSINRKDHSTENTKLFFENTKPFQEKEKSSSKTNRFIPVIIFVNAIISAYLSFIILNISSSSSHLFFAVLCLFFFFILMWIYYKL